MKILNLYAGIGGNRKKWPGQHQITAVEKNKEIAEIYRDFFPKDKVVVADAHKYLLKHYMEFDFIWCSPPCPTHSVTNNFLNPQGIVRYPDLKLYEEIIFLKKWFKGKWTVENVIPYYDPLIKPTVLIDRHYFWANFYISGLEINRNFNIANARASTRKPSKDDFLNLQKYHGFDLSKFEVRDKRLLLRNCVNSKIGVHIFNCAFKEQQQLIPRHLKHSKENL